MPSERLRRVNEAVRQVLSDTISAGLKDPRVGFVTVTAVRTSPDLRHAHVYVSVLGDADERAATLEGLRSAHGFLQRRVAGELRLKHTPTLEFEYDETIERGMRISELIDREADA
jgi:ribosome-binding factor A